MKLFTDSELKTFAGQLSQRYNLTQHQAERLLERAQRFDVTLQMIVFALALIKQGSDPDDVLSAMAKAEVSISGRKDDLMQLVLKRNDGS